MSPMIEMSDRALKDRVISLSLQQRAALLSAMVCGFLSQGLGLFNKYSYHDDVVSVFSIGGTYDVGRWLCGILGEVTLFVFGGHFSAPLTSGLFVILCIAVTAVLLVSILDIKSVLVTAVLGALLVTTPVVTASFGFLFCAPYYFFGLALGTIGVRFLVADRIPIAVRIIACSFLVSCSMGLYQAFVAFHFGTAIIYCISRAYWHRFEETRGLLRFVSLCMLSFALAVGMYLLFTFASLELTQISLSSYQGIDTMGRLGVGAYLERTFTAYSQFYIAGFHYDVADVCPTALGKTLRTVGLVLGTVLSVLLVARAAKGSKGKAIVMVFLVLLIPFATNLIIVASGSNGFLHGLMLYGEMVPWVYVAWAADTLWADKSGAVPAVRRIASCGAVSLIAISCALVMVFCCYDNACYLKADFMQESAKSYFTSMIAQIKSTSGYRDEYPIAVINEEALSDASYTVPEELEPIRVIPYNFKVPNTQTWKAFVRHWCGFDPEYVSSEPFADMEEVAQMPSYPDEGSIKVIDETVVIKF